MRRKSWSEKMQSGCREVKAAPKNFADIKAGQIMLLTTPLDVAAMVRKIPAGKSLDMRALRTALARAHKAEMACPVVTGICLRTVAEVVGEQLDAGVAPTDVVPVWRVLGPKSPSWKKLENGRATFEQLRRVEQIED